MNINEEVSRKRKTEIGEQYVTEFDSIPGFWDFLVGLDRNDLIAELIQNDLDQDATRTIISFKEDRLVCEGDGKPVDSGGWQRLRKIQGAGDSVPAKRRKIGVKNHGLKTAFMLGDELRLMSAGESIVQTLYAKGRNKPPYPGASPTPTADQQAPPVGCRIVIPYRSKALEPAQGEKVKLGAITEEEIDELFRQACSSIPEQFSGVVTPENLNRYKIVLRHWRLGEARFRFLCTGEREIAKRMKLFERSCKVSGTMSPLPESLKEQAVRRFQPLKGSLMERVPDFYRRKRSFFAEVSWRIDRTWRIDRSGKPKVGTGRYRYPIGYPHDSEKALTGHGAYFNVPVVSNTERHFPVFDDESTIELRGVCEELFVDALAHYAIPSWGSDGLNPLVPSPGFKDVDKRVRPLLAELVKQGAMPVKDWRTAVGLVFKGRKDNPKASIGRIAAQCDSKETKQYRFILPVATWAKDAVLPALSMLCPRSEMQLDPRTHAAIICLLANEETPEFAEDFFTFTQRVVFDCMTAGSDQRFGAIVDSKGKFTEPLISRFYLDLVLLALEKSDEKGHDPKGDKEKELAESLLLPDSNGQATPKDKLYSAPLPFDVPGLPLPPILHPKLISHPLFRRQRWCLPKYTMAKFLEADALRVASEDVRKQFWQWLCKNERHVPHKERPKLAELAIWPDENDSLARISELCAPRRHVGEVLAEFIRRPSKQVRSSELVSIGGRAHTSIRSVPTDDEITSWLDARLAQFELGSTPNVETIKTLHCFEDDLVILAKDKSILPMIKTIGVTIPALSQDCTLQPRSTLVKPGFRNDQLALPKRYLIDDRRQVANLDKLSPALITPTASMILDALAEDPRNFDCLQPRLKQLLRTKPDEGERERLETLPIIPLDDRIWKPPALAFIGNRGDYWGHWKKKLPGTGLSQNDQRRFREAGVISGLPNAATSRAFFKWLGTQDEETLRQHVHCVVRHILHAEGPMHWSVSFTDIPFIPARSQNGLRLVSLQTARIGLVFLGDVGDIEEDIIKKDPRVFLVVDRVKQVTQPITEQLRKLGVRSLREALKEPKHVFGVDNVLPAPNNMIGRLQGLGNTKLRSTLKKRLVELGVESDLLRHDWYDRLGRVKDLQIADEVQASYRFRGKNYQIGVDGGFNPESGVFWIKNDGGDDLRKLYKEIAKRLIFKPAAKPIHHFALEHAVALEINDPSFALSTQRSISSNQEDSINTSDLDEPVEAPGNHANDKTPKAESGHLPFVPNPSLNSPDPVPILDDPSNPDDSLNSPDPRPIRDDPLNPPGRQISRPAKERLNQDSGGSVPTPKREERHIKNLKSRQYAWHCQMCLCERTPQELAPKGSYIFIAEVRRHVIEAHHVDLKSAGGARHAGNLILLCKRHHDNFGDRLTRIGITSALQKNVKEQIIKFGPDTKVTGQQIEYVIRDTEEVIKLFFTKYHADFWLNEGKDQDDAS